MTELQKINASLRALIRTIYVQHQQLLWALSPEHYGGWWNRFALGYWLQKHHKLWSDEEWRLIMNRDIPQALKRWPDLAKTWKYIKEYYPRDVRKFIDEIVARSERSQNKKSDKKCRSPKH